MVGDRTKHERVCTKRVINEMVLPVNVEQLGSKVDNEHPYTMGMNKFTDIL